MEYNFTISSNFQIVWLESNQNACVRACVCLHRYTHTRPPARPHIHTYRVIQNRIEPYQRVVANRMWKPPLYMVVYHDDICLCVCAFVR